jgi:hypothetical protein
VQNELPLWEAIDVNLSKAVSLEVTGCVDVMPVPRESLGWSGCKPCCQLWAPRVRGE